MRGSLLPNGWFLMPALVMGVLWSTTTLAFGHSHHHHVSFADSWSIITLGDLHMEDDMTLHEQARQDCLHALRDYPLLGSSRRFFAHDKDEDSPRTTSCPLTKDYLQQLETSPAGDLTSDQLQLLLNRKQSPNSEFCQAHLISLGDLGRGNKHSRHAPGDAGTSLCFQNAKAYLDGFAGIPYDLVTGNHDLEGLDEFATDADNLQAWMDCFRKPSPQFHRYVGRRTLLLGLSTTRFRDAPYSSHEVHIDDAQIDWFQQMVESHPETEGWKILVFSHAPILGSGLRVLQNVHISSGCAWLNHSSPRSRQRFLRLVRQNPQIKMWASGHFHLSHEFADSVVQPASAGSCTFLQVGVIGPQSTRDGRRQTRFFRGCGNECIEIFTINHHVRVPMTTTPDGTAYGEQPEDTPTKAQVRLDATLDLKTGKLIYAQEPDEANGESNTLVAPTNAENEWFHAYVPQEEDGCYLADLDGFIGDASSGEVCWWHMADGKVLGLHQSQVVEYDAETLAPLGVVVTEEELNNREVLVVQNKTTLVLVDDSTQEIEVVHPNSDGSYWRKLSRSKVIRLEELAREEVAKRWMEQNHHHSKPTPIM